MFVVVTFHSSKYIGLKSCLQKNNYFQGYVQIKISLQVADKYDLINMSLIEYSARVAKK